MNRKDLALSTLSTVLIIGTYITLSNPIPLLTTLLFGMYVGVNLMSVVSVIHRAKNDESVYISMDILEANRIILGLSVVFVVGLVRVYGLKAKRNYDVYARVEDEDGEIYRAYIYCDGERYLCYDERLPAIGWRDNIELKNLKNDYVLEYDNRLTE